jgi:hypothetical protein
LAPQFWQKTAPDLTIELQVRQMNFPAASADVSIRMGATSAEICSLAARANS